MSPAVHPIAPGGVPAAAEEEEEEQEEDAKDKEADFKIPKLRLEIRDLAHPGSVIFLRSVDIADVLPSATRRVLHHLYRSPSCPTTTVPPTRSVTLILRDMDGVAYTTGSDLDNDHKEIHLSTRYIASVRPDRQGTEITGVLVHELVHCFQYNGQGRAPSGLIEGVADWVRLRSRLSPPHWKRQAGERWDAGYQTTAYFLDYLEVRFGRGTVRRLNEYLRTHRYVHEEMWEAVLGRGVEDLWSEYADWLARDPHDNGLQDGQDGN
ncbi:hypothetical protein ACRE_085060 [Hapsidospora chrysogenum ATCC 11550]|uniref:Uncharacterized protein n=1 Tax=Hapsidospora chrysogenum (strain ATCC 11550 / CBS 779.69 / DSM 880 / IAM 14645 / JCM 23072 / IMI 49137) TaxID=857340 RepID=A0A086SUL3_HAPC1|nr:hypothetical protein ACRE_085060 [Hapsidospora chrysogenum ATCC 11550]